MRTIVPRVLTRDSVRVPGSKSVTHRLLITAALADGASRIEHALHSEDTLLTAGALGRLGASVQSDGRNFAVTGCGGEWRPCTAPLELGNSGTSLRLLTALTILGRGEYRLTGSERLQQRPMGDLLDALRRMGIPARSVRDDGCPPVVVTAARPATRTVCIDCSISSQFLSALLLTAPCLPDGLDITLIGTPVSRPYVAITLAVLERTGIRCDRHGPDRFCVPGGQRYRAGRYTVEGDCSQASYFWAAAAVTGSPVTVRGIRPDTPQGDLGLVTVLERMGCRTWRTTDGVGVCGGALQGVTADMGDMPDVVPSLAVVAAFARGTTVMRKVGHLRHKESDRLAAVAAELGKMGIRAECRGDDLVVHGGRPRGALIDTYDDHRIAMSFAVAGLAVPGVRIRHPEVVAKSFPDFWQVLDGLTG